MILSKLKSTAHEARESEAAFQAEGGFTVVVGLIDATHVCIRAPEHEPDAYINRKKFHSLNLQVSLGTTEEPFNNDYKPMK